MFTLQSSIHPCRAEALISANFQGHRVRIFHFSREFVAKVDDPFEKEVLLVMICTTSFFLTISAVIAESLLFGAKMVFYETPDPSATVSFSWQSVVHSLKVLCLSYSVVRE